MKKFFVTICLVIIAGQCYADPEKIKVPGQDWSVQFAAPPLSKKQDRKDGNDYAFQATSGRFNLSFFIETPQHDGKSHKDCYDFYWPKSSKNPLISKDSIVMTETDNYVRVQYDIFAQFQGQAIKQRNVNYYVSHDGKWIDVHISIVQPSDADEQTFSTFDKSLRFGS